MAEDKDQQRYQHHHSSLMIDSRSEITVCLKRTCDDRGPEVSLEEYDIGDNVLQGLDRMIKLDVKHGSGRFLPLKLFAPPT